MFTVSAPPQTLHDLPLETEVTLGGTGAADVRASVADPYVAAITGEQIKATDPELATFVNDSDSRFYVIGLRFSLGGSDRSRIERATFGLALDSASEASAVVWSMSPLRLMTRVPQPVGAGLEVGLGPHLKLTGTWAADMDRERCYVIALGEGERDAEWRYVRRPQLPLDGVHQMVAIIRSPVGTSSRARIALTATARQRKFGLIPVRALIPPEMREVTFNSIH